VKRLFRLLDESVDPPTTWKVDTLPELTKQYPKTICVDTNELRNKLEEFFAYNGDRDDLLLFFAGHGIMRDGTGLLATTDTNHSTGGMPMTDLVELIQTASSHTSSITVILDCCGSGIINNLQFGPEFPRNVSILTSSFGNRNSYEHNKGTSIFTSIVCDGLGGGADQGVFGHVSVTSLVTFVHDRFAEEKSLANQQPTFRGYLTRIPILRTTEGRGISAADIDRLRDDFSPHRKFTVNMTKRHEGPDKRGKSRSQDPTGKHKTKRQKQFDYFKRLQTAGLLTTDAPERSLFRACGYDAAAKPRERPWPVYLTPQGKAMWAVAERRAKRTARLRSQGIR